MTNRELLERICEERDLYLEVLTYQKIVEEYLAPDIPTVEDFCGFDVGRNDIVYFVSDSEPCFVLVRDGEDIEEDEANDILEWLGEEYGLFSEIKDNL